MKKDENKYLSMGISLGLLFGAIIGTIISIFSSIFAIPIVGGLGVLGGIVLGSIMDSKNNK